MRETDFCKTLKSLKAALKEKESYLSYPPSHFDTPTDKTYCSCKDSNGESKYLYTTPKELAYVLASHTPSLKSYPCPYEKGWHVTKV